MFDWAAYNEWLYEVLNPDDKPARLGGSPARTKKREPFKYDAEREAFLKMTDQEKDKINEEHIKKMGL